MRLDELKRIAKRRKLDCLLVRTEANVRAFAGLSCDNAVLQLTANRQTPTASLYTDFRYVPMVHRVAPQLKVADIRRFGAEKRNPFRFKLSDRFHRPVRTPAVDDDVLDLDAPLSRNALQRIANRLRGIVANGDK